MKLYVGSLSFQMTEEDLRAAFEAHGVVDSVRIEVEYPSSGKLVFGIVEMPDDQQAKTAIEDLDGESWRVCEFPATCNGSRVLPSIGDGWDFREVEFEAYEKWGGGTSLPTGELVLWGLLACPSGHASADSQARVALVDYVDHALRVRSSLPCLCSVLSHLMWWDAIREKYDEEDEE